MYEDEGTNYNYEKGKYSSISFAWSENQRKLTIHDRKGQFDGMINDHVFRIIIVARDKPVPFLSQKAKTVEINYNGKLITVDFE